MTPRQFGDLYANGRPRTVRFLLSMGFPEDTSHDLSQFAWTRAWERIDQLRDDSSILSWVNTIALNEGRRHLRNAKTHVALSESHERASEMNLAAIDVARILRMCEPETRRLLEAQLSGISVGELAERNHISTTAVRIRNFRARRLARQLCEPAAGKSADRPERLRTFVETSLRKALTFSSAGQIRPARPGAVARAAE